MPEPVDPNDRTKYSPKRPYKTPAAFPTVPASLFENPAVFEKLDTDTLFFIFYFQQGTHQQYLAARELKRQSWRFHKKHYTWFQRHEDPTEVTDEYERGSYVYFDFQSESSWCQRIKRDFVFKYSHLEDEIEVATSDAGSAPNSPASSPQAPSSPQTVTRPMTFTALGCTHTPRKK
jgi:CCR4-NOT transcription complex subunit 3